MIKKAMLVVVLFSIVVSFALSTVGIGDVQPVTLNSVSVSPDDYACALPSQGDNPNAAFTIAVDATDDTGVSLVQADLEAIGLGIQDLAYNIDSGLWEGTFTLEDTSGYSFSGVEIPITANDDAGNGYQPAEGVLPVAVLILYDTTTPILDSECRQYGDSANLCNEQDFTNINFILDIAQLGSAACNNGVEMPWGSSTFQKILMLDFASVNFTDPSLAEKLASLASAIGVVITPPGQFGNSYVSVDTSAFEQLNTQATITLYGIPFATEPTIIEPPGMEGTAVVDSFYGGDVYELDLYDADTGEYLFTYYTPYSELTFTIEGFSNTEKYIVTDDDAPIGTITYPENGAYYASADIEATVDVDGTGTQLNSVQLLLDGVEVDSYDYWEILENCWAYDDPSTKMNCPFMLSDLTEGNHTLKVISTDLGGDAGNTAEQEISFTIDRTGPEITYIMITPEEVRSNETLAVTVKVKDNQSGIAEVVLYIPEIGGEGVGHESRVTEEIYSFFPIIVTEPPLNGTYTFELTVTDNLGNHNMEIGTFNVTETPAVVDTYLNESVFFNEEDSQTTILYAYGLSIRLKASVIGNVTTSLSMLEYTNAADADSVGLHLSQFVDIVAPELEGNLDYVSIIMNYSDADVAAKGIDESTLRLYHYDEVSETWVRHDGNDGGIDTVGNEVWATSDHFSVWGIFGSAPAQQNNGGGGGGGGGGGSSSTRRQTSLTSKLSSAGRSPPAETAPPSVETTTEESGEGVVAETEEVSDAPRDSGTDPDLVGQATGIFGRARPTVLWGAVGGMAAILLVLGGLAYRARKR